MSKLDKEKEKVIGDLGVPAPKIPGVKPTAPMDATATRKPILPAAKTEQPTESVPAKTPAPVSQTPAPEKPLNSGQVINEIKDEARAAINQIRHGKRYVYSHTSSTKAEVSQIQEDLNSWVKSYSPAGVSQIQITGKFDDQTKKLTEAFQAWTKANAKEGGIISPSDFGGINSISEVDGIVGLRTLRALDKALNRQTLTTEQFAKDLGTSITPTKSTPFMAMEEYTNEAKAELASFLPEHYRDSFIKKSGAVVDFVFTNVENISQFDWGEVVRAGSKACYRAVQAQAKSKGVILPDSASNCFQVAADQGRGGVITSIDANALNTGENYLYSQIKAQRPVGLGVSRPGGSNLNSDGMTDHYILATGMGKDKQGREFITFNDPAIREGQENKGEDLRLYKEGNNWVGVGVTGKTYYLTRIIQAQS